MLEVPVVRLDPELPLPRYARPGDAGVDLVATEAVTLAAGGGRGLVPTGVAVAIPRGFAGFIQPRSGLALRHGVTVLNTPGLIDADYRGELKVLLINTDPDEAFEVVRGERSLPQASHPFDRERSSAQAVQFERSAADQNTPAAHHDDGGSARRRSVQPPAPQERAWPLHERHDVVPLRRQGTQFVHHLQVQRFRRHRGSVADGVTPAPSGRRCVRGAV